MQTGCLLLVATPIGNMGDITKRAAEALAECDVVAAEDTRHSGMLLAALGCKKPMLSFHEHSDAQRVQLVLQRIREGQKVAYVTDAGTPCISDPGRVLVTACYEAGLPVDALPGPSAALCALMLCGLPCDQFAFEGFLPSAGKERKRRLAAVAAQPLTVVLFEAPHRIARTLEELAQQQPQRSAALCREMTKLHQEVLRGTLVQLCARVQEQPLRGEIALVLSAQEVKAAPEGMLDYVALLEAFVQLCVDKKLAAKCVAAAGGPARQEVYKQLLELKNKKGL